MPQTDPLTRIYQRIQETQTALTNIRGNMQTGIAREIIDFMCLYLSDLVHDPYVKFKEIQTPCKTPISCKIIPFKTNINITKEASL